MSGRYSPNRFYETSQKIVGLDRPPTRTLLPAKCSDALATRGISTTALASTPGANQTRLAAYFEWLRRRVPHSVLSTPPRGSLRLGVNTTGSLGTAGRRCFEPKAAFWRQLFFCQTTIGLATGCLTIKKGILQAANPSTGPMQLLVR